MSLLFNISKNYLKLLDERFIILPLCSSFIQIRERHSLNPPPKLRNPTWLTKKNRVIHDEYITQENIQFIQEVVRDEKSNFEKKAVEKEITTNTVEWRPDIRRTGVIARKIGVYPLWLKSGEKVLTTLLQVLDNHVIKYYTPEEYSSPRKHVGRIYNKRGCLLLGAETADPSLFTKEYCGIFKDTGVIPKKHLARFFVSHDAALPPGTPISVMHFKVGNAVDVRGKTIDRGFQGVMKRHDFSGMPASHGATKTHRRGGNIGGGGEKARVWPGTKMPGHMGNRYRIARGMKIYRINTKYNVMWVSGQAIPGETNSIVTVFDTLLPLRKPSEAVPFPTYLQKNNDDYPEDMYDQDVHVFSDSSIIYKEK